MTITKNSARLLLEKYHPGCIIGVDHITGHGSAWVVVYRAECPAFMHFRVAIVDKRGQITNNVIADQV